MSSPATTLTCLMETVVTGKWEFPVFVGFASALELNLISEAPAFKPDEENSTVAAAVQRNMQKWQRPLNEARTDEIAKAFGHPIGEEMGAIMPNPVLLAVKPTAESRIKFMQNGMVWGIELPPLDSKPIWVLDGQHRIVGMSKSAQSSNSLPFVLLSNTDYFSDQYRAGVFAKIFAQVSTEARPLTGVHSEWLSYAFDLNAYSPEKASAANRGRAMQTTKCLCENGASYFYNRITFLPDEPNSDEAFGWKNVEWVNIILDSYYSRCDNPAPAAALADALSDAIWAVNRCIDDPDKTALFGSSSSFGRRPVQTGLVRALLEFMADDPHNLTSPWDEIMQNLRIADGDWDLTDLSHGGEDGTRAPEIARNAFRKGLEDGAFPEAGTFSEWIRGECETFVSVRLSALGADGQPIDDDDDPQKTVQLPAGGDPQTIELPAKPDYQCLRLQSSQNLAGYQLEDLNRQSGDPKLQGAKYETTKQIKDIVTRLNGDTTKDLNVSTYLYGGPMLTFNLHVTFK